MLIKNISKLIVGFIAFGLYSFSYAATDHFGIEVSPTTAGVGEAIDVTIKALDKDGNVDKSYVGEVLIFSQSDPKAEFPGVLKENVYKFKTSDQGQVKFENAVKFTKSGKQDVNVFDVSNEDVFGAADIQISEGSTPTTQSGQITITSPSNGTTIGTGSLKINGETLKNYKVTLTINNTLKYDTISNSDGKFEVTATGVASGENAIKAQVFDADGKVLADATPVLFKVENTGPSFRDLKVTPEGKVEGETPLNIEIKATTGLDVSVILNDVIQKLNEGTGGSYTGIILAPKENGTYKLDISLKNELGLETKKAGVKEVIVENVELNAATGAEVNCDDLAKDLVIKGVKLTKMKSKSVLSWDKIDKAGSYNVYKKNRTSGQMELVQNVTEPRIEISISGDLVEYDDFAVKAVLSDEKCKVESKDFSDMTKVQTGPKEFVILGLALLITTGIFLLRKRKVA